MERNIRTIITNKEGFIECLFDNGVTVKYKFNSFWDLGHRERLIKTRKLPDGRTKYYIRIMKRLKSISKGNGMIIN